MFSDDDGNSWSQSVGIAKVTENSKTETLSYPRVFEANPGEIWIEKSYASFGGCLNLKLYERDFNKKYAEINN